MLDLCVILLWLITYHNTLSFAAALEEGEWKMSKHETENTKKNNIVKGWVPGEQHAMGLVRAALNVVA